MSQFPLDPFEPPTPEEIHDALDFPEIPDEVPIDGGVPTIPPDDDEAIADPEKNLPPGP